MLRGNSKNYSTSAGFSEQFKNDKRFFSLSFFYFCSALVSVKARFSSLCFPRGFLRGCTEHFVEVVVRRLVLCSQ